MFSLKEIKKSIFASLWFMFLTFPIMVIKVDTIEKTVVWRWYNLVLVGVGTFFLSFLWRYLLERREVKSDQSHSRWINKISKALEKKRTRRLSLGGLMVLIAVFPFVSSLYQTSIMITALMYVVLGLGLNIVVGFGGLLNLGFAGFYAVGAYTYGLLYTHFGLSFWLCLPIGALVAALLGLLIGLPILRLRGDYLAIVTLAFGEIIRIVLENWDKVTFGPSGIKQIGRPSFFGMSLKLSQVTSLTYFIAIGLTLLAIFVIRRLENSKIGRAWEAMREDEIACQAMGIDITRAKLTSFSMGAIWAGLMGVLFAAKTTFINPASFTTWESIVILCVVVIGGMGSIPGVIVGALIFILTPEYLRAFSDYRMLIFGISLVMMMIFRPGGIIPKVRKKYKLNLEEENL